MLLSHTVSKPITKIMKMVRNRKKLQDSSVSFENQYKAATFAIGLESFDKDSHFSNWVNHRLTLSISLHLPHVCQNFLANHFNWRRKRWMNHLTQRRA